MDSGVYIYAAADGKVVRWHDGEFDRSTEWKGGGLGNFIGLIHQDSLFTFYGHMVKHSLLVKMGDYVKAGQVLGKVGSSGNSKVPHLHFEVRDKYKRVIDPFSGDCQKVTPSLWISQPPYDLRFYLIEQGFIPYRAGFDLLKERYGVRDTFYTDVDSVITFWLHIHGLQMGKIIRADWYEPNGKLHCSYSLRWKRVWWRDFATPYIKMPDKIGKWTVKFYVDGDLITSGNFCVMRRKQQTD